MLHKFLKSSVLVIIKSNFYFYILIIFFIFKNNAGMQNTSCDKSRQLLNSTWGIITHGPKNSNYTQNSYCEWLIKAPSIKYSISLIFQTMATECSYDYVFVYDGETFNSPLLGSFSGKNYPQYVIAESGYMLILLYSDANYVLGGFQAEFSVTNCPRNCTDHGKCINNKCVCDTSWGGIDCSYELCPDNCGSKFGRGFCEETRCNCSPEYSGQACDLFKNDSVGNRWHFLSGDNGLYKRAAHTAVYIKETDSLYVFGGYDLNDILGDLSIYSFEKSMWINPNENVLDGSIKSVNEGESPGPDIKEVFLKEKRWSSKPEYLIDSVPKNVSDSNYSLLFQNNVYVESDVLSHQNLYTRGIRKLESQVPLKADMTKEKFLTKPSPRYGHTASRYPGGFVIYGGKTRNGNLSDELWFYNVTTQSWSLRAQYSVIKPPKLTRHTLTLVGENSLYLFGGSTIGGEFSSKLYSIQLNLDGKEQWKYIRPRGGKEFDVRLVGHTAVYSPKTHSLIIYGGIMAGLARLSKLSDRMFLFKISSRHWSEVYYPKGQIPESHIPRERAFHTSVVIGNYLVVFGGYSHRHNKEEICYDNQLYLYHLECHTWISREVLGPSYKTPTYRNGQGVFSHAADVRGGNTLLVSGGYHGNVNGNLWAYVLPPTLASQEGESFEPEVVCGRHHSLHECTSNPECGWCSADEICYGRTTGTNCTTNLQTTRCPGLCPSLGDCHSCLIHGEMSTSSTTSPFSVAYKLKLGQCAWCVQNARCHHKDDNYGVCGLREDAPLQGTEITSVEECRIKDRRPGLTFIKYMHPANWSHPDFVTIVNSTSVDFEISVKDIKTENLGKDGAVFIRLLGYLRIPAEWSEVTETLKICASFSNAVLQLARSSPDYRLEIVGNVSANSFTCRTAYWPSGSAVILHPGRYLIDFESKKSFTLGSYSFQQSKIFLKHNKSHESAKTFTFEYLEPYQNGSCLLYNNCLHCLTDSLCGWCDITQTCLPRDVNEPEFCKDSQGWKYLTLQPSTCVKCSNYISCDVCVGNRFCEWLIDEAKCSRRGRASFAVLDISQCPVPCHLRNNCSFCLNDRGRCVWCESTQECFSFSVYTSEYQFGICREWLDQNYSLTSISPIHGGIHQEGVQCKSCSRHLNCSSCLHTLSCGWCYDINNPIIGVCVPGDFGRPYSGTCNSIILNVHNISLSFNESGWSYAQCPDVDECRLKLDNCHPDAVCTNTPGSFSCMCKRGFYGDGRLSCIKTCYNECINGICSMAPDYRCQCDLGWTGENCGIDCGCHNHSTCNNRVGVCDECQDWTSGEFCQFCKVGSYGNATLKIKCKKCECNGHGDSSLGYCDSETGVCFCKDNTEGENCEKCKKGYYGNPENGGMCYYECIARGMILASDFEGIGSHRSNIMPWEARLEGSSMKECLWILNGSNLTNSSQPIQLTVYGDINVACQNNSVIVYEGLPDLVSFSYQNQILGTFCERDDKTSLTVEAKTGVITVLFKQGENSEGFNASYSVFRCPNNCPPNRACIQNECVCKEGWTGPNCSLPVCYNNCSFNLKQGVCDKEYGRCICKPGFGSFDCSVKINDYQIIFTELFNSEKLSAAFDHLKKVIPRFGHSVVIDRRGSLWMFGGYSLSHGPLNDIRLFDTKNNTWMQVTVDSTRDASMPQGRYFHAAEIVHSRREIFVFGGIGTKDASQVSTVGNKALRDFWKFSIKSQRWLEVKTKYSPPSAAGHTLTLMNDVESENLVLIGGFCSQGRFLRGVWCFNLETDEWEILKTSGVGPKGIYGHTTAYHAPTKSFYIYGGYHIEKNGDLYSRKLYSFYYPRMSWSLLPTFEEYNPLVSNLPQPRFLHSAVTTKEYMLVFGGKMSHENSPFSGSNLLIAYSYACNQWIRLLYRGAPVVGFVPPPTYAQAMTYDSEAGAAYIVGGFDNVIYSHVTRINLPQDLCNLWSGKEKCRSFLGCSFCSVAKPDKSLKSYCYSSSKSLKDSCNYYNGTLITNNGVVCDSKWFQHRSCEHFKSCSECLAKWPAYINENSVCKWCRNCSRERCVFFNQTCGLDGKCNHASDVLHCFEDNCSDLNHTKCNEKESCEWGDDYCAPKGHEAGKEGPQVTKRFCSDYKDCSACLTNNCRWSSALKECLSSDFQPLYCAGGICGLVLNENNVDLCPVPCFNYNQCATCLRNSHCGWCSLNDHNHTGRGLCIEGTIDKPSEKVDCSFSATYFSNNSEPHNHNSSVTWHYMSCPEENECSNGHHTCDPVSEVCRDLPRGFECVCGPGFKLSKSRCEPVCSQGCVRGKCDRPDHCLCDFGYVGANCSIQCQCNGHSNCAGPDQLDVCVQCHNNTKGRQCDRCLPFFVGDPTDGGKCVPCFEYCNQHTEICINDSLPTQVNKSILELTSLVEEGPKGNALCLGCTNQTKGRKCDECMDGYFRGTDDLRHHCRPCECHGHGDRCDPITGEECNCANNTESQCQSSVSKNSNQQCWMLQCSKCKESYWGVPTEGHQCYKQMTLDHKFCLSSVLIEECETKPKPLYPGESAFFQVQPRYVNVDIRLFIDVMQGSLDLYMSLKDDSLIVLTNTSSGQHYLEWDPKYKKKIIGSDQVHVEDLTLSSMDLKLSLTKKITSIGNLSISDLKPDIFYGIEREAEGLTTYVTVHKRNTLLHVKNIRGRLIVTLPKDKFDLISTRFYLGLVASSENGLATPTYGVLFFRQDQLHIDLFVFFSVFFSCFFLFLAGCLIAWKAKQAADIRRARRRHVVEMLHMAKRPFAKVILHLENDDANVPSIRSPSPHRWKRNKSTNLLGEIRPVAIEPTEDGLAAIATFLIKLPGGSDAPVQVSLASSLILMSRMYSSRVFLRRRSSHHAST